MRTRRSSPASRPIEVAIVGGGCGAMSAAFELTRPELAGRFAVTVYQVGWRLGGKGASGRGAAQRIEEHGLHVWMGFYENAFRLMRECYAELARDPGRCPIARWEDAFTPAPHIAVVDQLPDGGWLPWTVAFPAAPGAPGDPLPDGHRWTIATYVSRAVEMLRALLTHLDPAAESAAGAPPTDGAAQLRRMLRVGELTSLAAIVHAIGLLQAMLPAGAVSEQNLVVRLLDAVAAAARSQIEARAAADRAIERLWTVVDLTLATLRGIVRFGLLTHPQGFDAIDDYDCREWLLLNGCTARSLDSGYLRGLYDLGLSYEDGDPHRPRTSAGQAVRSMVRAFFTYRGSFYWRMQAGMGDVVFAPLYEVLRRRGVQFRFFHRLENVRIAWDAPQRHVEALEFDVQAEVAGGREYQPLIDVRGLPCWPAAPDYSQLVDGERLAREGRDFESWWDTRRVGTRTLRVSEDFDFVVLGVGLGAVPFVCRELVARDPRWRAMVDRVRTVPSQAFQLWLREDMAGLGWSGPPVHLSAFVEPFDTWADMRHLIAREQWPAPPRAIAYFCNAMPDLQPAPRRDDPTYPARARAMVRDNAIRFLEHDVCHLWPRAVDDAGRFRWSLLASSNGACPPGPAAFETQYWTANVNPSDRYVLALPGSSRFRISPLDRTYDNLTIAGDWTANGFNVGCVESAIISGRLAAHALAGSPALEAIVGYDHP
ncbi:MAG TPA: FAD-dependent oxidoreductase [Candidatus Limnocylindria bacterium]|nr:FAD-dependent oxidoreductase [Candidatus Limnocylindria bacterium]